MAKIQELLDKEDNLSNRRYYIVQEIKALRGSEPPLCWGLDDCSSDVLSRCPWRVDCDSYEAVHWQEKQPY